MKRGIVNNCIKCKSSYGKYDEEHDNDWEEYWCVLPIYDGKKIKTPKGLCQFCNSKSKFYLNKII